VTAAPHSRRRFVLTLGAIVALGPLSIDMYLPALPELQRHFGADASSTQLTLSSYFAGLAIGQIVYGPLSDRIGRKGPLLFGMVLYTLASLGCLLSPSIEWLIATRFLQALGGCAGIVITRAMVRDCYPGPEMARILSSLVLVMGVAPILAPALGAQVLVHFGWHAIFAILVAYGVLASVLVASGLVETCPVARNRLSPRQVVHGYGHLLAHRKFMGYALSGGVAQSGMFAYISVSAFVFIGVYGLAPDHFGWLFGLNAFGLIAASQLNSHVLKRVHSEVVLRWALRTYAACGVLMLLGALTGFGGIYGVAVPLFFALASMGFTFPNSIAAAMAPFGDRAGMASALLGTLQFTLAAGTGALAGWLHDGTAVPMTGIIALCGIGSTLLLHYIAQSQPRAAA
jgi:DHA1 family bicyclomycin/chloramphenicol resistance-like MFS transporter